MTCDAVKVQADVTNRYGFVVVDTCCRSDHRDDVHIDGRSFPVIPWRKKNAR